MNKNLRFILLMMICCLTGCSESNNNEQSTANNQKLNAENDEIIMGTSADYTPFEFVQNEKVVGFDIDLANTIADKLGVKLQVKDMQFYSLIPSLENGDITIAMASISETPERAKVVDLSVPYYYNRLVLLVIGDGNTDEPIAPGMKIGVQTGTLMYQWLKKQNIHNVSIITMDGNLELIEDLKNKGIDGVLLDEITAKGIVRADSASVSILPLQGVDDETGVSIAVKKNSVLLGKINAVIEELKTSGKLNELKAKWGL